MRPLVDEVRHHAVQADGGKQQRERREDGGSGGWQGVARTSVSVPEPRSFMPERLHGIHSRRAAGGKIHRQQH